MTLAEIQKKAQDGKTVEAQKMLAGFLAELFPINIVEVIIREDRLSLNSVNGFVVTETANGRENLFFKFHHEENEEAVTEYYNSKLLAENGFPVETPVYVSKEVGKQVLLYKAEIAERMADTCKRYENFGFDKLVDAQAELDKISCERYLATLHEANPAQLKEEPILQLFYNRLLPGGRSEEFYAGKELKFPGLTINYDELKKLKWRINGVEYNQTLEKAFSDAFKILAPDAHGNYAAVIAHGDAHNGNVWYKETGLTLFDPAFAGRNIPALLAEIKATFHNIFAHPLWLYDSAEADKDLQVSARLDGDFIEITHNWKLSPLRQEFLDSKEKNLWKPLIAELKNKSMLPADWEEYMRSSLFCCPTLVMNLRANAGNTRNFHTLKTSALGLAISIMLSSPPVDGKDVITKFFSNIAK